MNSDSFLIVAVMPPSFTMEMGIVFAVIAATFVVLAKEWLSPDLTGILALGALVVTKALPPALALQSFGSSSAITVACMFILGAGLQKTGAFEPVARWLERAAGGQALQALAALMAIEVVISAFINNTLVVVVFLPLAMTLAVRVGIAPSKLAIPVVFAAILGGTCTLIGTSANIVVNGSIQDSGGRPFGMFEFTALGLIVAALGILYMLIVGHRLLPVRETLSSLVQTTSTKEFRTEAVVLKNSPLIGKKLAQTPLRRLTSLRILGVVRGGAPLDPPFDQIAFQEGDRLVISCVVEGLRDIQDMSGISLLPEALLGVSQLRAERVTLVEGIVSQNSQLISRTLREINFQSRYNVKILGLHRQGLNIREKFEDTDLKFGDSLLMQGSKEDLDALRDDPNFLLLSSVSVPVVRRWHAPIAVAIVAGVIVFAAGNPLNVWIPALLGSLALVLTGCLKINEAYEAVNWKIVFLIVGMLGLGHALKVSHGAAYLAQHTLALVQINSHAPWVMVIGLYFVAMVLTNLIHHNAVAAVLTPIAIQTAAALSLDARPFLVAVLFAVSASFSTPASYQCNAFAYAAGGYRFADFLKVGLPLNILLWIVVSLLIPWFWPFTPVAR